MNTFVWVLLVYTSGGNWIPTLEFTTELKCTVAADVIRAKIIQESRWGAGPKSVCVRVEK